MKFVEIKIQNHARTVGMLNRAGLVISQALAGASGEAARMVIDYVRPYPPARAAKDPDRPYHRTNMLHDSWEADIDFDDDRNRVDLYVLNTAVDGRNRPYASKVMGPWTGPRDHQQVNMHRRYWRTITGLKREVGPHVQRLYQNEIESALFRLSREMTATGRGARGLSEPAEYLQLVREGTERLKVDAIERDIRKMKRLTRRRKGFRTAAEIRQQQKALAARMRDQGRRGFSDDELTSPTRIMARRMFGAGGELTRAQRQRFQQRHDDLRRKRRGSVGYDGDDAARWFGWDSSRRDRG
jgi:hypothetical protein